ANVAAAWSLVNKTGGVAGADLAPIGRKKSRAITGHPVGSAQVHDVDGTFTDNSGVLTVIPGTATQVSIETAANGSGTHVGAQNVVAGSSVTGYAIERDSNGNFVANVAAAWSLVNKTGGVAGADLA